MAQQTTSPKQSKYHLTLSQQRTFNRVMYGVILVGIGVWIGGQWFSGDTGYATNLYTELLSIGVTVGILNFLAEQREAARRKAENQTLRLVSLKYAGSTEERQKIIDEMKELNLLEGAYLADAALQEIGLIRANLKGSNLRFTNLYGAIMIGANLQEADFYRAKLDAANLQNANLHQANLEGAINLNGDFFGATLPDGAKYTGNTDMRKYTDPDHPDFWQPAWVKAQQAQNNEEDDQPTP